MKTQPEPIAETILTRQNGSKTRIRVELRTPMFAPHHYTAHVDHKPYRAKDWRHHEGSATPEEIHSAKLKFWESLRPVQPTQENGGAE